MSSWCTNCDGKKILQNVTYPAVNVRPNCNKCQPCSDWCDDTNDCNSASFNKGTRTKNIPIFKTTYVGRATRHIPMDFLEYYDCSKQRGGMCGSTNNIATDKFKQLCSAGRCEYVPPYEASKRDEYLLTKKQSLLKHNNNYTGSSKKLEYAKFIKRTPGMETFASKKGNIPVVKEKLDAFVNNCCKNF